MSPRLSREESKARTRARLIKAGATLFYMKGYAATSLEEIAEAAEVTKGAIYRHFASKEELFLALAEGQALELYMQIPGDESGSVPERLAALGRRAADVIFQGDRQGEAMTLEYLAACLRRPEMLQRHSDLIRRLIAKDGTLGEQLGLPLRADATVTDFELTVLAQAILDGLILYRFIFPDIVTKGTFAAAFQLLASAYEKTPSSKRGKGTAAREPSRTH
ncbi:MAG: TetR/AcrR family transcriptional regulator [Mycobacteriales bacterium]